MVDRRWVGWWCCALVGVAAVMAMGGGVGEGGDDGSIVGGGEERDRARQLATAAGAVRLAARAVERIGCRGCGGTGEVERRRQVGWRSAGGSMRAPVHRTFVESCPLCAGRGLPPVERLLPALGRLHRSVVTLQEVGRVADSGTAGRRIGADALADARAAMLVLAGRRPEELAEILVPEAQRRMTRHLLIEHPRRGSDAETETIVAFVTDPVRSGGRGHLVRLAGQRVRIASTLWEAPVGPPPRDPSTTAPPVTGDDETGDAGGRNAPAHADRSGATQGSGGSAGPPRRYLIVGTLGEPVASEDGSLHTIERAAIVAVP